MREAAMAVADPSSPRIGVSADLAQLDGQVELRPSGRRPSPLARLERASRAPDTAPIRERQLVDSSR